MDTLTQPFVSIRSSTNINLLPRALGVGDTGEADVTISAGIAVIRVAGGVAGMILAEDYDAGVVSFAFVSRFSSFPLFPEGETNRYIQLQRLGHQNFHCDRLKKYQSYFAFSSGTSFI